MTTLLRRIREFFTLYPQQCPNCGQRSVDMLFSGEKQCVNCGKMD
jgi:hypothetical protein